MQPTKVWIHGITGRIGKKLFKLVSDCDHLDFYGGSAQLFTGGPHDNETVTEETLVASLEASEIIIDFSSPPANMVLLNALSQKKAPLKKKILIGTTGLSDNCKKRWADLCKQSQHSILIAPNTSMGIFMLSQALKLVAPLAQQLGFDCEIVETHHKEKIDAPSGTALRLAETINNALTEKLTPVDGHHQGKRDPLSMGIHAIRGGDVFGEHEIRFIGQNEEVALKHRAFNRDLFTNGAIKLAQWLREQPPGLYSLDDVNLI